MSITLNKLTGGSPGSYTYDKAGSSTNQIGGTETLATGALAPGIENPQNNIVTSVIRSLPSTKVVGASSQQDVPANAIGQNADGTYIYSQPTTTPTPGPNFSSITGKEFYIPPPVNGQNQYVNPDTGAVSPTAATKDSNAGVGLLIAAVLALVVLK
jgi:hypothetical protein